MRYESMRRVLAFAALALACLGTAPPAPAPAREWSACHLEGAHVVAHGAKVLVMAIKGEYYGCVRKTGASGRLFNDGMTGVGKPIAIAGTRVAFRWLGFCERSCERVVVREVVSDSELIGGLDFSGAD